MAIWVALALAAGLGVSGVAWYLARRQPDGSAYPEPPDQDIATIPFDRDEGEDDGGNQDRDVEALGRMLSSEDRSNEAIRRLIGWTAVETARRGGRSLYQLLTQGDGYGPQVRGSKRYYAATTKPARAADLELAAELIGGFSQPSAIVRQLGPGGWFERGVLARQTGAKLTPAEEDARMLEKQGAWGEGIYGRASGTKWFLYSRKAPLLAASESRRADAARRAWEADKSAANEISLRDARRSLSLLAPQVLDAVPEVEV